MTITIYLRDGRAGIGDLPVQVIVNLLNSADRREPRDWYGLDTSDGHLSFEARDVERIEVDL